MTIRGRSFVTADLPRQYWLLWTGTLVNRLGGFVVPFLTLYLTTQRLIPVGRAALMVSLYGAGSFLAQLTGGELADRLGRRPVLLLSLLAAPLAMIALGFARTVPMIAACAFALGFLTDLYRPAVNAAVADLVPPAARTRAYGYLYWAVNLGFAVAPIVAGWLAGHAYLALFIGDAVTTFSFGVIVLVGLRETRPPAAAHAAQSPLRERLAAIGRAPVLLLFCALAFGFGLVYMQGHVTLPVDMRAHGFGYQAFADRLPLYAAAVAIWTLGEIIAAAVAPSVIADLAPVELRGLYQGVFGASWGLAFFIGPVLGGRVLQDLGAPILWLGCMGLGILLTLGYLALGAVARART